MCPCHYKTYFIVTDFLSEPDFCPDDNGSLSFPLYYNDGTMFQTGPSTHNVWGFTNHSNCGVIVQERCDNGYSTLNISRYLSIVNLISYIIHRGLELYQALHLVRCGSRVDLGGGDATRKPKWTPVPSHHYKWSKYGVDLQYNIWGHLAVFWTVQYAYEHESCRPLRQRN